MQLELTGIGAERAVEEGEGFDASLSQWMTPAWVAEAVVRHVTGGGDAVSTVIEPSCGTGRFVQAIMAELPSARVIGVEIDGALAARARATGAEIVTGDFRTTQLPVGRADLVIGNPPFQLDVFDGMLQRAHELLEDGGRAVFILPAFTFQTSSRVVRYNRQWTISQEMMPRTIFPGIRLPLMLARFTRDPAPRMFGMLLYHESNEVEGMPDVYRRALSDGRSGWKAVVEAALERLGGEATVAQVCAEIAPRRPTATEFWRPKVRQQLGRHFRKVGPARYAMAA